MSPINTGTLAKIKISYLYDVGCKDKKTDQKETMRFLLCFSRTNNKINRVGSTYISVNTHSFKKIQEVYFYNFCIWATKISGMFITESYWWKMLYNLYMMHDLPMLLFPSFFLSLFILNLANLLEYFFITFKLFPMIVELWYLRSTKLSNYWHFQSLLCLVFHASLNFWNFPSCCSY